MKKSNLTVILVILVLVSFDELNGTDIVLEEKN